MIYKPINAAKYCENRLSSKEIEIYPSWMQKEEFHPHNENCQLKMDYKAFQYSFFEKKAKIWLQFEAQKLMNLIKALFMKIAS